MITQQGQCMSVANISITCFGRLTFGNQKICCCKQTFVAEIFFFISNMNNCSPDFQVSLTPV